MITPTPPQKALSTGRHKQTSSNRFHIANIELVNPTNAQCPCCDERRHAQHIKIEWNKERDFRKRHNCY